MQNSQSKQQPGSPTSSQYGAPSSSSKTALATGSASAASGAKAGNARTKMQQVDDLDDGIELGPRFALLPSITQSVVAEARNRQRRRRVQLAQEALSDDRAATHETATQTSRFALPLVGSFSLSAGWHSTYNGLSRNRHHARRHFGVAHRPKLSHRVVRSWCQRPTSASAS